MHKPLISQTTQWRLSQAAMLVAVLALASLVSGCAGKSSRHSATAPVMSSDTLASTYVQRSQQAKSVSDADRDGVADSRDECKGTGQGLAVDAFGCPVPLYVHVIVPHGDKAPSDQQAFAAQLDRIADLMRQNPAVTLHVQGHCSNTGAKEADRARTMRWASRVRGALVQNFGIDQSRITAQGKGASSPMVSSETDMGRRRNQRLELTLSGYYASRKGRGSNAQAGLATTAYAPLNREEVATRAVEASRPTLDGPVHLRFAYGGTQLINQDQDALERLGAFMQANPQARIQLVGHTDSKGSEAFNLELSRRRAMQVREMLVSRFLISPQRFETTGMGESDPIADNASEEGRRANRRVSVTLLPAAATGAAASRASATGAAAATSAKTITHREIPKTMEFLKPGAPYRIKISVKQCKLWLYELDVTGKETLVRTYPVATPRPGLRGPEGLGTITRIDFNPWWVPTANLKRAALRKGRRLPDRVRPNSPANPMGKFKIHLSHGAALRIHGTNKPRLIGQRVSAGCIRMQNDQGLELARAVSVGTEVLVID